MNADERRSQAWDEFFNGPFKTAVEAVYDESAGWTFDLLKSLTQVAASSFKAGWESRGGDAQILDNHSGLEGTTK